MSIRQQEIVPFLAGEKLKGEEMAMEISDLLTVWAYFENGFSEKHGRIEFERVESFVMELSNGSNLSKLLNSIFNIQHTTLKNASIQLERIFIYWALLRSDNCTLKAAQLLDLDQSTVQKKIIQHNIDRSGLSKT